MNLKRFCISAPARIPAYKMANLAGIQAHFYYFTIYDIYWDSKPRLLLKSERSMIQLKALTNTAGLSGQSLIVRGRVVTGRGISSGRLTMRYSNHEGNLELISVVH